MMCKFLYKDFEKMLTLLCNVRPTKPLPRNKETHTVENQTKKVLGDQNTGKMCQHNKMKLNRAQHVRLDT